ncbi:MAG: DUF488 family protein [Atopobiaceae bacterium]|jgi:uncharacterized protein YeaO (DUF488 family)
MATFHIKRIYETPEPQDGKRILVDRLWPRGMKKERAKLDAWEKELAPSSDLRKSWGHDSSRFKDFACAYRAELDSRPEVETFLSSLHPDDTITLLYAAKDPQVNHAVVLRDYLAQQQEDL